MATASPPSYLNNNQINNTTNPSKNKTKQKTKLKPKQQLPYESHLPQVPHHPNQKPDDKITNPSSHASPSYPPPQPPRITIPKINPKDESILTSEEYNKLLSTIQCNTNTKDSDEYKDNMGLILKTLLEQCDWNEKLYFFIVSLLGGATSTSGSTSSSTNQPNMNQFTNALSSILRTRKQLLNDTTATESNEKQEIDEQTANKLRQEVTCGILYCTSMMNVVQSILNDFNYPIHVPQFMPQQYMQNRMHPPFMTPQGNNPMFSQHQGYYPSPDGNAPFPGMSQPLASPNGMPQMNNFINPQQQQGNNNPNQPMILSSGYPPLPFGATNDTVNRNMTNTNLPNNKFNEATTDATNPMTTMNNPQQNINTNAETVAEGNPNGSTLRKHRPKNTQPQPPTEKDSFTLFIQKHIESQQQTAQEDGTTIKKLSKKEITNRFFDMIRFRPLEKGDYVAARLSATRDLYIVMRVVKPYAFPSELQNPSDVLAMTEAKRTNVFKEKVYLQDVEDYKEDASFTTASASNSKSIPRHQILPLPRTYSEASDWGVKCRKGYRVYAMYPKTTSLYCGTVVDNTTYCRGEDDIIVVEFDGDEDDYGKLPQRHIPARFVTLVPQCFPNAKFKRKRSSLVSSSANSSALNSYKKSMIQKNMTSLPSASTAANAFDK